MPLASHHNQTTRIVQPRIVNVQAGRNLPKTVKECLSQHDLDSMQACKICGQSLKEPGAQKTAVAKKAKKRKRDEEGDSQYGDKEVGISGATGEVQIYLSSDAGVCISW